MDLPVPAGRDVAGAFCAQGGAVVADTLGTPLAHGARVLFGFDISTFGALEGTGLAVKEVPVGTLVIG